MLVSKSLILNSVNTLRNHVKDGYSNFKTFSTRDKILTVWGSIILSGACCGALSEGKRKFVESKKKLEYPSRSNFNSSIYLTTATVSHGIVGGFMGAVAGVAIPVTIIALLKK